jgi:hypothetical protein
VEASRLIFEMETEMLENLVRLLNRGAIGSAEWYVKTMQDLGLLRELNIATIKRNKAKILEAVKLEMVKLSDSRLGIMDSMAIQAGKIVTPSVEAVMILSRWENVVARKLETIYGAMLQTAGKQYMETAQKALAKTALGTSGRRAVAEIVEGWADSGLPAFVDRAGKTWTPEAYASTIVRSSSTQMATETQLARMDELGENLVQISSHLGARPKCEPYQGKIFWTVKPEGNYDSLYNDTSYGQVDGLFGINCGHTMYPYFHGMKKTYQPYPKKENEKAYAESQKQRLLERNIRKAKRQLSLANINGDEGLQDRYRAQVKAYQARMRGFIDDTGRRRDYDREQIRG